MTWQLNLKWEAYNLKQFQRNFSGDALIQFPDVIAAQVEMSYMSQRDLVFVTKRHIWRHVCGDALIQFPDVIAAQVCASVDVHMLHRDVLYVTKRPSICHKETYLTARLRRYAYPVRGCDCGAGMRECRCAYVTQRCLICHKETCSISQRDILYVTKRPSICHKERVLYHKETYFIETFYI